MKLVTVHRIIKSIELDPKIAHQTLVSLSYSGFVLQTLSVVFLNNKMFIERSKTTPMVHPVGVVLASVKQSGFKGQKLKLPTKSLAYFIFETMLTTRYDNEKLTGTVCMPR